MLKFPFPGQVSAAETAPKRVIHERCLVISDSSMSGIVHWIQQRERERHGNGSLTVECYNGMGGDRLTVGPTKVVDRRRRRRLILSDDRRECTRKFIVSPRLNTLFLSHPHDPFIPDFVYVLFTLRPCLYSSLSLSLSLYVCRFPTQAVRGHAERYTPHRRGQKNKSWLISRSRFESHRAPRERKNTRARYSRRARVLTLHRYRRNYASLGTTSSTCPSTSEKLMSAWPPGFSGWRCGAS